MKTKKKPHTPLTRLTNFLEWLHQKRKDRDIEDNGIILALAYALVENANDAALAAFIDSIDAV